MLRVALLVILTAGSVAAAGCGEKKERTAAAPTPMDGYRAKLAPLAPLESEALEALTSCTGERYTDDATVLHVLNQRALPRYREYVDGLKKLDAAELVDLHARLVAVAERELAVLEKLARAIDRRDGTAVLYANREHRALRAEADAILAECEGRPAPAAEPAAPVTVEAAAPPAAP